jgi:hypothetical protein
MKKANLKKITLGIAMALGCNLMTLGLANNVEAAEFDVPIAGIDATTNATYADAGILVDGKYVFADAETTLNKGGTVTLGGWVVGSVNAVISNNNPDQNLVIDLQGNDLNINSSQTGITAGKNAKIDIYNPGKITIDTNSNNMAAAFFVKTGGHIHVHNGGENGEPASWDNAARDLFLAERARELMWESHRRTDLIRYDLFSSAEYLWPFKGGESPVGQAFPEYKELFAIPASQIAANPDLKNPTGY